VGKQEGKRQIGRRRREDNITIDLIDIERGGMDWNHVVQDRVQGWTLVNFKVLIKCWEFLECVRNWQLLMEDSAPWSYYPDYVSSNSRMTDELKFGRDL
jgi:hypothetical protein